MCPPEEHICRGQVDKKEEKFAAFAGIEGYPKALIMVPMTFELLMDEVIVPYENNEAISIDGVPPK